MLVIDYLLIGGFVGISIGILVLYLRLPSPKAPGKFDKQGQVKYTKGDNT
tara:strand:- start:1102 stop:1251 length:150 start_codon:yes stop_codon:yes gene_type:complete